jgi:hypothetical protein
MAEASGMKRECAQVLKSKKQQTLVNVFGYIKTYPEQHVRWMSSETAVAMGTSKTYVFQISKERSSVGYSQQGGGKKKGINNYRNLKISDF